MRFPPQAEGSPKALLLWRKEEAHNQDSVGSHPHGGITEISESVPGSEHGLTCPRGVQAAGWRSPEEMGGVGDKAYQSVENDDPEHLYYAFPSQASRQ